MIQLTKKRRLWLSYAMSGAIIGVLLLRLYHYIQLRERLAFQAGALTGRTKEHARQWHEHIDLVGSNNRKI